MKRYAVDSSFSVKGLIAPRRRKQDAIFHDQHRRHLLAKRYLGEIQMGLHEMHLPAAALLETAIVTSRLTNQESQARNAAEFLKENATRIYYDEDILEHAIDIGIQTKGSGYDTLFLTVAEISNAELLTDDRHQHESALSRGITSYLLREMVDQEHDAS
jgi:predicted nucleic acid-binding protein